MQLLDCPFACSLGGSCLCLTAQSAVCPSASLPLSPAAVVLTRARVCWSRGVQYDSLQEHFQGEDAALVFWEVLGVLLVLLSAHLRERGSFERPSKSFVP